MYKTLGERPHIREANLQKLSARLVREDLNRTIYFQGSQLILEPTPLTELKQRPVLLIDTYQEPRLNTHIIPSIPYTSKGER